jgi:hypothetical protein
MGLLFFFFFLENAPFHNHINYENTFRYVRQTRIHGFSWPLVAADHFGPAVFGPSLLCGTRTGQAVGPDFWRQQ